jgi:hypothetical protein
MRGGVVISIVLSLFVVALAVLPAAAQDRLDAVAAAVDRATTPPAAEAAAVDRMAKFLDTTPDVLRAERASTRLGWGDVFVAHRIASRGGHPIAKVFAARRSGAAWGEIAEEARVDAAGLVQDVAVLWPDAARATSSGGTARPGAPSDATPAPAAPTAAPEGKKGLGGRVIDFLRGAPSDKDEADERGRGDKPADRTQEEIRDRMIRGGGRSR